MSQRRNPPCENRFPLPVDDPHPSVYRDRDRGEDGGDKPAPAPKAIETAALADLAKLPPRLKGDGEAASEDAPPKAISVCFASLSARHRVNGVPPLRSWPIAGTYGGSSRPSPRPQIRAPFSTTSRTPSIRAARGIRSLANCGAARRAATAQARWAQESDGRRRRCV
jgi:hypothetical protein